MEKAIEIKRRAQRFIQSGDLNGALKEYEKLVALDDIDPYNFVLLADLLYKRGDAQGAAERYLAAAADYEKSGLYKNAIAVCKKMMRLSLSPLQVLERLAQLHLLDGLATEASLYYQQFADHLVRENRASDAARSLRKAYEATPEEVHLLERLAEVYVMAGAGDKAGLALAEAGHHYQRRGMSALASSCRERAEQIKPGALREFEVQYLLASGSAHKTEAVGSEDDGEDEEAAYEDGERGPPLLPSLENEGEGEDDDPQAPSSAAATEEPEFERFPTPPGREVGLQFRAPGVDGGAAVEGRAKTGLLSAAEIEALLHQAQEKMRVGEHEAAGAALAEAAQAYEAVGRHDNAATIFRSLGKSSGSSIETLKLWLANCERRDDRREAAEVACEIGDRAIGDGDTEQAREWFERALRFDENNAQAQRRLQRLDQLRRIAEAGPPQEVPVAGPPGEVPAQVGPSQRPPSESASHEPLGAGAPPPEPQADRVELALGRSEAVSFDLGGLLSEFQRGIEAQLSGDPQGHYDLAMAYREMGLLDHAIESFRMALGAPSLAWRAAEMLGRCLLDQGRFEEAAEELGAALERPGVEADAALSLGYLLGLAHEAAGRPREALAAFERVFTAQPSFQDVAQKVRDARKALGNA